MNRNEHVTHRELKETKAKKVEPKKTKVVRSEYVTHELKTVRHHNQHLTQEEIAHQTGLSRATIQLVEKGKPVKPFTAGVIRSFAAENTPIIWPRAIHAQFEQYKSLERLLPRDQFRDYIGNLEELLEGQRGLDAATAATAGFLWLLAWVSHDLSITFKERPEENIQRALSRYDRAIGILTSLVANGHDQYAFLLNKAKLAQWVSFYAGRPEVARVKDPEVIQWIQEHDLVKVAYACAQREPYEWSAIRNGLVMASILRSKPDCLAFHQLLINAHSGFRNLDFVPMRGVKPLSQNTDLAFFLNNQG